MNRVGRKILLAACAAAAITCACGARQGENQAAANKPAQGDQPAANSNNVAGQPDIAKLGAEIASLEAQAARSPGDQSLRDSLAEAYVRRGSANYAARQLDAALKDYQSALSYDPTNEEAQLRITQINQETGGEPRADDGKPATVTAKPGAANSNL
ncbi:MAG: tetratricopeptide repeat protein [Acidobacteria bacterium]|nr:tetratricopeptide repeat protein [Acidobacteriota bacterium]MCA1642854.1 tetratricopeptide repeat protein [Acidobacteriota bacterium]